MGSPNELEAVTLGLRRGLFVGEDAVAGRLQHQGTHHPEGVTGLAARSLVAHPVGVQSGLGFAGQSAALLPLLEQGRRLPVAPVGQFHPDHVERAAAQQLHPLLFGNDVVRRADHVAEGAGDGRIGA